MNILLIILLLVLLFRVGRVWNVVVVHFLIIAASQFRLYDHNFAEIAAKTDQAPEVRNIQ